MKGEGKAGSPRLLYLIVRRIVLFGLLAMALQVVAVSYNYLHRRTALASEVIRSQADQLEKGLVLSSGEITFALPENLQSRYGSSSGSKSNPFVAPGYYLVVRDDVGTVLFTNCGPSCMQLLPDNMENRGRWIEILSADWPMSFVGGRHIALGETRGVQIDQVVWMDPDGMVYHALLHEIGDHMAVPMLLLLLVVIGGTVWSLQRALRPVVEAARQVETADPLTQSSFNSHDMPFEVARFANAVDRAFIRIRDLVEEQKTFSSAMAHELRTPISVIVLELERVDDPGAIKAIADLHRLSCSVDQLTALARLESRAGDQHDNVSLRELLQNVVRSMAPHVYENGLSIEFISHGSCVLETNEEFVELIARNLIDNAVRHAGKGAGIVVTAGPGPRFAIEDNGRGPDSAVDGSALQDTRSKGASPGLGLRIVCRVIELLDAGITFAGKPGSGLSVTVVFPQIDDTSAHGVF